MHRVAISQVSSSERLDILFLSFFFPVLPFFYTIVVSTGSSKRRKKKKNDGVYYSIRENEREREIGGASMRGVGRGGRCFVRIGK